MKKGNPWALLPIAVFLVLYLGLGLLFEYVMHIPMGFYNVPIIIAFLAAILVVSPYVLATSGITLGNMNAIGWVNLLIVGFFHTGVTYCMYFTALKDVTGQQVSILSYIDPLVAVLISVIILGESMTVTQALGGAMILGFTLWNELPSKRK